MNRATRGLAAVGYAIAAGCALPTYGSFEPLHPDVPTRRVEHAEFSILVPEGWNLADPAAGGIRAWEEPPANGRWRVYRILEVDVVGDVAADQPAALAQRALERLRALRRSDELVVAETGSATIGGRDAFFLRGTCGAGAAGLRFEVLDFLVPGVPHSLAVRCSVPEGQLAASRDGFVALAQSLQPRAGPPSVGGDAGRHQWFDGDRVGLHLDVGWQRQADDPGALAVFVHEPSGARCDLATAAGAGVDLDRVAANYVAEKGGEWRALRILSLQRATRSGRQYLRLRAVYQDDGETIVVDDSFAAGQGRLDRLLFRVPWSGYRTGSPAIDAVAASLRWKAPS